MLRLALDRVRIELGQIWIRVGLGHSCSGWIGLGMNRFGSFRVWVYIGSFWVRIGSVQFGSFRIRVYIRSIRFRVGSISDWVILSFGLSWVNTTSGRFGSGSVQFWFRIEIGSGLSDVGSAQVSGHSVWFSFARSKDSFYKKLKEE